MFYSDKAKELRSFVRDALGFPATDVREGWLIFDLPEADMGCHPTDPEGVHGAPNGIMDISFYCDDIQQTVAELKTKGVVFKGAIEDQGFGWVTHLRVPGYFWVQLYQTQYQKGSMIGPERL